jgi:predicted nuclease of predicted toxin-antitoxin system
MKILVDMNLSPEWLGILSKAGWQASHWKDVGSATAADSDLLAWAREHHAVVVTQDLDFSQLLFQTQANGPSVVLLRIRDELDAAQQGRICRAMAAAESSLETGALVVIDEHHVRLRHLPIKSEGSP